MKTESTPVSGVHRLVVGQVVEVDVDFQHLIHGRTVLDEFFFQFIQHVLGVGRDVALEVGALAGEKEKVAVFDGTGKQGGILVVDDVTYDLFRRFDRGGGRRRLGGAQTEQAAKHGSQFAKSGSASRFVCHECGILWY